MPEQLLALFVTRRFLFAPSDFLIGGGFAHLLNIRPRRGYFLKQNLPRASCRQGRVPCPPEGTVTMPVSLFSQGGSAWLKRYWSPGRAVASGGQSPCVSPQTVLL
ncbi:hypothetical protein HMPREF9080_01500 [Cardiobacterium valvarum F0432]|uniref:Uncharacterized protein n=1 Tax=Cardiobacterium valvarum F0432 TaxID=797473 RepID=G9ZFF5_9GAMM|nr:hypothetical protein HMPREF9080_01500 [Cardiobacterium valvarum F0432]